jgi:predicted acylesterase/phospholipase RssA
MQEAKKTFRILSFSGGGMRGIFQSTVLSLIENRRLLDPPIAQHFDLIAGTSTGSIIAIAVASGVSPQQVSELYERHGSAVFSSPPFANVRRGPRYNSDQLEFHLRKVFGDRTLRDCTTKVCVAATVLDDFTSRLFRNYTIPNRPSGDDSDLSIVDVLLASCAAPTYFSPRSLRGTHRTYLDGGLWANNPALSAVLEALRLGQFPSNVRLISVGNGRMRSGMLKDQFSRMRPISPKMITTLLDMMFAVQNDASNYGSALLLGNQRVLQIDTDLDTVINLDDPKAAVARLPGLAEAVIDRLDPKNVPLSRFLIEPDNTAPLQNPDISER